MAKHTPTPWRARQDSSADRAMPSPGFHILPAEGVAVARVFPKLDGSHEANAEFIVRAVNSHGELLEAAKAMLTDTMDTSVVDALRAAIAKAEGGGS